MQRLNSVQKEYSEATCRGWMQKCALAEETNIRNIRVKRRNLAIAASVIVITTLPFPPNCIEWVRGRRRSWKDGGMMRCGYAYLMLAAVSHAPMQSGTDVCLARAQAQRMNLIQNLSVILSGYEADEDVAR